MFAFTMSMTASAATPKHFHAAVSTSVHHVTPTAAETTKMVVVMPSPAETEDDARTIAVVGVAAMTATVPITAVAMAIAAVVNRLRHRALASRRFEQIQADRRRVGRSCRKREQAQRDGSTRDH